MDTSLKRVSNCTVAASWWKESVKKEFLHEMKTKSQLNRKVRLAFGSAILAILVVVATSYHSMVVSRESEQWVRHTHEVLEKLQDLLSSMETIESSYRGFVLAGNESYLENYSARTARVKQDETTVRALTVDNPVQQSQLSALERLDGEKIQFGEMVIGLRRSQGLGSGSRFYSKRTGPADHG
jgi:CHASE3 domain sensor protein